MSKDEITNDAEREAALAEIERLWKAPLGSLDVTRIMLLRQRVQSYEKREAESS